MHRRPTGAGGWPGHRPFQKSHPTRSSKKSSASSLPSGNLFRASPGFGTWSAPLQPHRSSSRVLQHWRPLARSRNRFTWPRVACETAPSSLPSPSGSTPSQRPRAKARARTREAAETTAGWKTRASRVWTHWETTTWAWNHAANADAECETHRRSGGRSPPC